MVKNETPDKIRWATRYSDGSERTVVEVDTSDDSPWVTIDPDSPNWNNVSPEDLTWLAARLLDAAHILAARETNDGE